MDLCSSSLLFCRAKKAKEALAASAVKIAGRDVLATWKVLISLGVAPVLYTFYAFIATFLAIKVGAPLKWKIWTPTLVFVALPFMNYAALKFGEAGMDVLKSLRPLIVALIPGQQRSLDKLKSMRLQLSNEVADLINDFGPLLYKDFNEWRILVPSASVPPSSGTPGIWRRKSGTGAVDAQGLGLTHPMTWIDERLFGWSRSAKRGTSAWAGPPGADGSRIGTPDDTDDEDTGDYDDVVGLIPVNEDQSGSIHKSRSRQSSYADLQRLRLVPLASNSGAKREPPSAVEKTPSSPKADPDRGLHTRQPHRNRRESLSDGIPVTRIAAADREDHFVNVTHDLNDEVQKVKPGHEKTT